MLKKYNIMFSILVCFGFSQTPTRVSDINGGNSSSGPSYLTVYNNKLYFAATNGSNSSSQYGDELWVYEDDNHPRIVYDIRNGTNSSSPTELTVYNNKLYFSANNGSSGAELWVYDGVNTPSMVYNINSSSLW